MPHITVFAYMALMVGGLTLAACGSDPALAGTKGQELQDLQGAYQSRAITPDEYEEQKEEVLDR